MFDFPVTNAWGVGNTYDWSTYDNSVVTYTGLDTDWHTMPGPTNCSAWSYGMDDTRTNTAALGAPQVSEFPNTDSMLISVAGGTSCDAIDSPNNYAVRLVCVSQ